MKDVSSKLPIFEVCCFSLFLIFNLTAGPPFPHRCQSVLSSWLPWVSSFKICASHHVGCGNFLRGIWKHIKKTCLDFPSPSHSLRFPFGELRGRWSGKKIRPSRGKYNFTTTKPMDHKKKKKTPHTPIPNVFLIPVLVSMPLFCVYHFYFYLLVILSSKCLYICLSVCTFIHLQFPLMLPCSNFTTVLHPHHPFPVFTQFICTASFPKSPVPPNLPISTRLCLSTSSRLFLNLDSLGYTDLISWIHPTYFSVKSPQFSDLILGFMFLVEVYFWKSSVLGYIVVSFLGTIGKAFHPCFWTFHMCGLNGVKQWARAVCKRAMAWYEKGFALPLDRQLFKVDIRVLAFCKGNKWAKIHKQTADVFLEGFCIRGTIIP